MSGVPAAHSPWKRSYRRVAGRSPLWHASGRGGATALALGVLAAASAAGMRVDVMYHCPACGFDGHRAKHVEWGAENALSRAWI